MNYIQLKYKQRFNYLPCLSIRQVGMLLCMLILSVQCAFAGTYALVPAQSFKRLSGSPVQQNLTFTAIDTASQYTFNIYNGGLESSATTGKLVSSATVKLNGMVIYSPDDFNQNTKYLTKQVSVNTNNTVEITLKGKPGGLITIVILGEDNDPPVITASVNPVANAYSWHNNQVVISFDCDDAVSGIASCTDPVTLSLEGAAQIITGTAVDVAGNVATTSVVINIDKTPPTLTIVAPANNSAQTQDPPSVVLELNDNLALDTGSLEITVNNLVVSANCQFTGTQAQCTLLQAITGDAATIGASVKDMADNSVAASTSFAFDSDADGFINSEDVFPNDPNEWADLDGDGIGDNADLDRDGDGISNDYETQTGTDPNDSTSTPPDQDGDAIPDSLDDDRDGDGISNDYETQVGTDPDDPTSTPPDQDGDAIPDSLDDDRDGDGVNNEQDSYPDDATRTQLAAVQNLSTLQQGVQISVSWQNHPESFVQGYRLYRADYEQANWALLNTSALLTDTLYIDSNVTNGQAYQYRVTAVDGRNNESIQSTVANQFVIYNSNTVTSTQTQWNNYKAQIGWAYTPAANETYRLYRLSGTGRTLVLDGSETQYIDAASYWSQIQHYELASVLSFTNPITASAEQAEGPATGISLQALPAIDVALTNAVATGVNSYQIEIQSGTQLSITGTYVNALAEVQLSLNSSQGALKVTRSDGTFQFVLRDTVPEIMSITLIESGAPADRSVTLGLNVTPDQTPLTVVLSSAGISTSESSHIINGQVINADVGVKTLIATSNRYDGQSFGLILLENNNFSGELPLKTGDNLITVNAAGNLGQTAQASITIDRQASAIPSVEITSHQNNQIVTTNSINLQGRLYTSLEFGQLQFFVDQQPAVITSVLEQVYQFRLDNIELNRGFNRIVTLAQTPLGNVETAIVIYYQVDSVDPAVPLELVMTSPFESEAVNDTVLVVRGQLFNAGSETSLTVNGVATPLFGESATGLLFSYAIDLSSVPEGPLSIDLAANSTGKDPVSKTINVTIDNQPPVLTVNNALSAPPTVNEVREQPYRITGSVSDINLSTLSINGQGLILQPAAGDTYSFDTGINLNAGEQTTLTIVATDTAGNETSVEYLVSSNPQAIIEVIQPLANTEYLTTGATHGVELITRINGVSGGENLVVSAGTSQQSFAINQEIVNGVISINTADTITELLFEIRDAANEVLTSTEIPVTFINEDTLPLTLEKTNPARNEQGREPHHPIQLYFNKPVNLADLVVTVKETIHGKTYISTPILGASFTTRYKGDLVEVHKDQSEVAGGLSLLPGGRIVEFYPDNDISYGASVFVNVKYQNQELTRFIYSIRQNPTFVTGLITNQLRESQENIVVSLPELSLTTTTDQNGVFTFGQGLPPNQTIASGLYKIVANHNSKNPDFGVTEQKINIEQGKMNEITSMAIPRLDPTVSYNYLASGKIENILAGGDLIIDTHAANLTFSDNANSGNVHTQLAQIISGLYKGEYLELTPHWMFNLQPGTVLVSGNIGVTIKMPKLYGSHDYLPADGTLVLVMGQNNETLDITPIGVGILNEQTVTSVGLLQADRLNFLGVTIVPKDLYPVLQDYIDGNISLSELLVLIIPDGS